MRLMGGKRKTRGRRPIIDAAAKVAMLAAVREGRRLDEVASSYGVTLQAFYSARRRDALFAAAWADAHALSAEAERRCPSTTVPPVPLPGPSTGLQPVPLPEQARGGMSSGRNDDLSIAPNNRRRLQRRKMRHVRFDARRKGAFLAHFAWSGDAIAAAAAAGVCERTVYNHRRSDPAFAGAFQAALDESYLWLEAEAARERLEAQRRLRAAVEEAERGGDPVPPEVQAAEFERTMKLLAHWRRRGGRLGAREVGRGRLRRMDFDDAMVLLKKRLDRLGIKVHLPPPEGAGAG